MFFNSSLVNQNQTISLTNDNSKKIYQIICSSIGSRPDVTLSLYDTKTLNQLSNNFNSVIKSSCNNTYNLCNEILLVNFQFTDDRFNTMTSLSCGTTSKIIGVPLSVSIARNTTIIYEFKNSQFLIGDVLNPFSILCNGTNSSSQQITWISSYNKTQIITVQNNSRISFINNGLTLSFANLTLSDEQYYSCGILKNNTFTAINSFFLYVRGN